jgi:hypothetical protein
MKCSPLILIVSSQMSVSDGAALFAAFDLANHRSIAIPKSAQLLLAERSNEGAKIEQHEPGAAHWQRLRFEKKGVAARSRIELADTGPLTVI